MKASTEKSATTTSTTATQPTQEPFFGKKGGDGFFDNAQQGNAPFIQAKLTINQPGDIYEQEADRVADQVVQRLAMPSSQPAAPLSSTTARPPEAIQAKCADCEQEEKLQRKEEEGPEESEEIQRKENAASPAQPGDEAGSDFSSRLQSSKGGGSPLPENTRTDMESALGTDLSGVRIHTGGEAAGMSKSINAQAFTHGSDVYFNEGKFDAGSTDGKRLLAHELVHVGQQGGGVKRKIRIGEIEHAPTAEDYSKYNKELLDKMHNNGEEPPLYSFKTDKEFEDLLKVRGNLIASMIEVVTENNSSTTFGLNDSDKFQLPSYFWKPVSKDSFIINNENNVKPADAVRSIFNNGKKETYLDCNMMMVALQYKSILETLNNDEKFNLMFPAGKDLYISGFGAKPKADYPTPSGRQPFDEKNVFVNAMEDTNLLNVVPSVKIDPSDPCKNLLPGDWIYFENNLWYNKYLSKANNLEETEAPKYRQIPIIYSNEWQGEHAVYIGNKQFSGFGMEGPQTYQNIMDNLYGALRWAIEAYYNSYYYDKYFINDNEEKQNILEKEQKDWEPAKISKVYRMNYDNLQNLGK